MKPLPLISLTILVTWPAALSGQSRGVPCAPDNAGLTLPRGFCALVVADTLGAARHLVAAPNGDLLVAVRGPNGGVIALRDEDGDGVAETRRRFGVGGGTGIALTDGHLYFATDDAVVRWAWRAGQLEPAEPPDTVVRGLLSRRQHAAKSIAIGSDGALYVNIGAPSNACQERDRAEGSAGIDPCPLLDSAGGIWRFDAGRLGQTQRDGRRYATGLRNVVALGIDRASGGLYGAQHGRDDLARIWPRLYTVEQSAEKPAEELFRLEEGGDYGWPYCHYDPELRRKVLSPEYGGDGRTVGRCASARDPLVVFPAHWAPNALVFYTGTQFPASYRGGVFVAFHGSWNRAPLEQAGFNVAFVPFERGTPRGAYTVFADGFAPDRARAAHRPTGLAVGPDGSLYVSDDRGGRIYRIMYRGR
jgi:glucose/arabinose dehydrogenase